MIDYKIVSSETFMPNKSEYIRYKKKSQICEDYICLDTETSHNHAENKADLKGWVYQWCFSYRKTLVYGRKPSDFIKALSKILEVNNCSENNKIMCFVHNLPYDFQYLKQYLIKAFGKPQILAYAPHKVFNIEFNNGLIIRCSYKLSNKSLDKWSKDLDTKHKKLVGTVDYDIIRYQDTKLTKTDWRYMFYDVIVLDECIEKQLLNYNDTISTMPITSTAYTRREIQREFNKDNKNFVEFNKSALSTDIYNMYVLEMSGGITHGNRFLADTTIKGIIKHRDFVSHYPSQQRTQLFPVGKTSLYFDINKSRKKLTLVDIFNLSRKYCVNVQIIIKDLKLKSDSITLPYAQESKFRYNFERGTKFICDNGRILEMNGRSRVVFNELDLKWIYRQYNFTYLIEKVVICPKKYLPSFMSSVIDEHFKGKSDFKIEEKTLKENNASIEEIREAHTNLMKSKNVVNGIYGCTATALIREDIDLLDDYMTWKRTQQDITNSQDKLNEYYNSRSHCMRFEWGCYTTAYARDELMTFVELIGYEKFIYADTDSIFYISNEEIEKKIEDKNSQLKEQSEKLKAYIINSKGEKIYYNQFDDEKENITDFRFLHAKCYSYIVDNKDLNVVIAGVPAYNGKMTREKELGNIDNLTNGFTFTKCGGKTCIYIENEMKIENINGHFTEYGSSAIIQNSTKTLNIDIDRKLFVYMNN